MLSIFINLIFVSGFCFLLIIFLEYAIYLWENKEILNQTTDASVMQNSFDSNINKNFVVDSQSDHKSHTTSPNMKFNISNKYFERSLVLVQSQDYKGWFEKITEITKKVATNLGYYSKKAFKYIIDLSKSGNNFPDQEEKHIKSVQSADKIKETVDKITQITENDSISDSNKETSSKSQFLNSFEVPNNVNSTQKEVQISNQIEIEENKIQSNQGATLNLAVDDKLAKDTTTYDKIEKSILTKLQDTGLNHYDIWLELGHFYQKYDEKEKAKEIFAMVMKHAQGRDKDLARDGLIALS
jgi:hypothetical protein